MLHVLLPFLIQAAVPANPAGVETDDDAPAVRAGGRTHAMPRDGDDDDDDDGDDGHAVRAAGQKRHDEDDDDEEGAQPATAIVVTARRLDAARTEIAADLGATAYTLDNDTIEDRPGGETGSIADILAQTPGITVSGSGLAIRGSGAVQVRINNVIVPEAISDPADRLSSRFAQTTRVLTGTLPAQFGFAPGGVIAVTTKNGLYQHGGQAEFFVGNHAMVEPALEWAGSTGSSSVFASGSYEHGDAPVADASGAATTDHRRDWGGLAFADHVLDDENRISVIAGGSSEHHSYGTTSIGPGTDQTDSGYVVGTFQHTTQAFTMQASLFAGSAHSETDFALPDRVLRQTFGAQLDTTWHLSEANTLRVGALAGRQTFRDARPGRVTSGRRRTTLGIYVQDQVTIASGLTFNGGLRADWLRGPSRPAVVEPRASLVWEGGDGFSAHAGYARYAAAAPLGESAGTAQLPDERDDYFDVGAQQKLGAVSLGIDGYWRTARNLIVERQTIGAADPSAFAFDRGRFHGVELTMTYASRRWDAWANVAVSHARAWGLAGGASLFSASIQSYLAQNWILLASERPVSASGGIAWHMGKLDLTADVLAGSGAVRADAAGTPNAERAPAYADLGLSAVYHLHLFGHATDVRADLRNITGVHYLTGDAGNLEGGWTRRDPGRTVMFGIEQGF